MAASQHVKHGRRKNMPKSFDQSSGKDSGLRHFEFSLALKPGTLPHDIESNNLHKAVENEYITKYLERIGAAPTKTNMDYVRKHAPLAQENVKANLKVKGNMTDEVAMQAPEMNVELHLPPRVPNKSMLVVGMVNHVQNRDETDHGDFIKPWGADLKTAGVREVVAERGEEPQFDDMTSKFVYPYNIRLQGMQTVRKYAKAKIDRQKSQAKLPSRGPSRTGRSETAETSRSRTTSAGGVNEEENEEQEPQPLQDERSGRMVSEEDLEAELEGDFEVTPEVVLALQSDFEHSLRQWRESVSDETMGRVTASDFQATLEALCSDLVLHLFGTVCAYMYDEYVNPSRRNEFETASECAEWEKMQRDRSFVMHRQFASITKEYRSSRSRLFFTLPILILSMRTCVETLFREVFPLWTSIPAGVQAMRMMQETVTEMFDPHGYYSNLSILQSAPAAVRIMDSYKHLARKQLNQGFSATSPLVRAAYSDTKAFGTRQMLYRQQQQQQHRQDRTEERLAPAPELAPDQKFKLMDMARSIPKKGKDLRQLGRFNRTDRAKWLQM